MPTALLEREELLQAVKEIPDDKLTAVLRAVRVILQIDEDEDEGDEPNEETAKILRESEAGLNMIGPFHNMNDFMTSLLSDDDA
jgi:hypothetical protein